MPEQDATLRDFSLPRNGPGTRTVWLVFFSTLMTVVAMCGIAMHFWYEDAQAQIAKTHPVVVGGGAVFFGVGVGVVLGEVVGGGDFVGDGVVFGGGADGAGEAGGEFAEGVLEGGAGASDVVEGEDGVGGGEVGEFLFRGGW